MSKQPQEAKHEPPTQPKINNIEFTEQPLEQSYLIRLANNPVNLSAAEVIQSQSDRLANPHLQTAQRVAMATQVGRIAGNQFLQRMIAQPPGSASGKQQAQQTGKFTTPSGVIQKMDYQRAGKRGEDKSQKGEKKSEAKEEKQQLTTRPIPFLAELEAKIKQLGENFELISGKKADQKGVGLVKRVFGETIIAELIAMYEDLKKGVAQYKDLGLILQQCQAAFILQKPWALVIKDKIIECEKFMEEFQESLQSQLIKMVKALTPIHSIFAELSLGISTPEELEKSLTAGAKGQSQKQQSGQSSGRGRKQTAKAPAQNKSPVSQEAESSSLQSLVQEMKTFNEKLTNIWLDAAKKKAVMQPPSEDQQKVLAQAVEPAPVQPTGDQVIAHVLNLVKQGEGTSDTSGRKNIYANKRYTYAELLAATGQWSTHQDVLAQGNNLHFFTPSPEHETPDGEPQFHFLIQKGNDLLNIHVIVKDPKNVPEEAKSKKA